MINDPLADRSPVEEQASNCLALWAAVLTQGIRDAASAEVQRLALRDQVRQGLAEGLLESTATVQHGIQAVQEIRARLEAGGANGRPLTPAARRALERSLKDREKVVKRMELRPAILYAGLDEATEWLWSDSLDMGSFLQIYNLFSALPPVDEFRRMFIKSPGRFLNVNLEKVFKYEA